MYASSVAVQVIVGGGWAATLATPATAPCLSSSATAPASAVQRLASVLANESDDRDEDLVHSMVEECRHFEELASPLRSQALSLCTTTSTQAVQSFGFGLSFSFGFGLRDKFRFRFKFWFPFKLLSQG